MGRQLGHEDEALINGMVIKETQRTPSSLLLPEDAGRRQPSLSQEIGPHQTSNLLASCSWTASLQNSEKQISVVYKLPSLWYFG